MLTINLPNDPQTVVRYANVFHAINALLYDLQDRQDELFEAVRSWFDDLHSAGRAANPNHLVDTIQRLLPQDRANAMGHILFEPYNGHNHPSILPQLGPLGETAGHGFIDSFSMFGTGQFTRPLQLPTRWPPEPLPNVPVVPQTLFPAPARSPSPFETGEMMSSGYGLEDPEMDARQEEHSRQFPEHPRYNGPPLPPFRGPYFGQPAENPPPVYPRGAFDRVVPTPAAVPAPVPVPVPMAAVLRAAVLEAAVLAAAVLRTTDPEPAVPTVPDNVVFRYGAVEVVLSRTSSLERQSA